MTGLEENRFESVTAGEPPAAGTPGITVGGLGARIERRVR